MKLNKLTASLFFAGMLLLSGCGSSDDSTTSPAQPTPPVETPAPGEPSAPVTHATSVVTIDGETIPVNVTTTGFVFAGYEGKPVLLEFYGDTCPHCITAIPMYNSLEAKYGNEILILTIDAPGAYATLTNAGLQDFAARMGMQYRTVAQENEGNMKAYAEGLVGPMAGVPYLIILDGNGNIITQIVGNVDESTLEGYILDLL